MGNSSSKAARKLPTRASPTWVGARTSSATDAPTPSQAGVNRASEQRTAGKFVSSDINRDASDPDFLANLNKLGPVRVNHSAGMQSTQHTETRQSQTLDPQISKVNRLFQSRAASEEEASSLKPSKNHLFAGSLQELLNERKSARTDKDLQKLAAKYGVDVAKMESLARFLTSPSVDKSSTTKTVDKNGEETVTFGAVWINPRLQKS